MSANTELSPALSAEQWAAARNNPPQQIGSIDLHSAMPFAPVVHILSPSLNAAGTLLDRRTRRDALSAVIALANDALPDDSPHKITRADVGMLRYLIENREENVRDEDILALGAKLAALLLPE